MTSFGLIGVSEQEFLSHSVETLLDSVAAMQPTRLPYRRAGRFHRIPSSSEAPKAFASRKPIYH
jgi:hypothetical protein